MTAYTWGLLNQLFLSVLSTHTHTEPFLCSQNRNHKQMLLSSRLNATHSRLVVVVCSLYDRAVGDRLLLPSHSVLFCKRTNFHTPRSFPEPSSLSTPSHLISTANNFPNITIIDNNLFRDSFAVRGRMLTKSYFILRHCATTDTDWGERAQRSDPGPLQFIIQRVPE